MKSIRVNVFSGLVFFSVLLLIFSYFPSMPLNRYYEDFTALLFLIFIMTGIKRIKQDEKRIIILLLLVIFIGVLSNYLFKIVTNPGYILNDCFCYARMFLVFIGSMVVLEDNPNRLRPLLSCLSVIGRCLLIVFFIFGILNQIGIVDMYWKIRFGIKCYTFIFKNASQFGVLVGCILGFVLLDSLVNSNRNTCIYEVAGLSVLIMTGKGMSWIIASTYIVCIVFARKRIKWWTLLVGVLVLLFVLRYQIDTYLLNSKAPRAIFIYYGIVTAVNYFPLGSGFATYGSNIAGLHYSPLYVKYGFLGIKALSDYSLGYLNDVYLGMLIGEFGFIGLMLHSLILFNIGKRIIVSRVRILKAKYIVLSCFICLCGMSVMAGSVKNAPGEMIMLICAVYLSSVGILQRNDINILNNNKSQAADIS